MERKTYYDAEPWYRRENSGDWYQQMEVSNEAIRKCLSEIVNARTFVTEVACGGGWLAEYLTALTPRAYRGFDFAETAVSHASNRLQSATNFSCVRGDALSSESYDPETNLILAHQFLHCLIGDDRKRWLAICNGVLAKNSGALLLSSMIGLPDGVKHAVDERTRINRPGNRYYAEDAEIQSEIKAAGFRIEKIVYPEPHVAIYFSVA